MFNFIRHHLFQYIIILLLFAITVTALVSPIDRTFKILVVGISLGVYFFWAIWHHWEDHKLTWATFMEYLLITAILFWLLINLAA